MAELQLWTTAEYTGKTGTTKATLEKIFHSLAKYDSFFNGKENIEKENHNWDNTVKNGFQSNCQYLVHEVLKDVPSDKILKYEDRTKLLKEFVTKWTKDNNYYEKVTVESIEGIDVLFVSVAVLTR